MPAISTIVAALGVAAAVGGSAVSYIAQKNQGAQLADLQKKSMQTQQTQMNLDAMRQKRSIIRQAQLASASASATANAQGAGESSGLSGGLAGISAQAGTNATAVNQNQDLGNRMFGINYQRADVQNSLASSEALGSGLTSLGGSLVQNSGTIGKVGNYLTGRDY